MTEDEARAKDCCQAKATWAGVNPPRCIASECMAWRVNRFDGFKDHGYCGLAGPLTEGSP